LIGKIPCFGYFRVSGVLYLCFIKQSKPRHMTIEAKTINTGTWVKITVVSVVYGFSQVLHGDKWINTTDEPQRFESEILTLGEYFTDYEAANVFMKTKAFKAILKTLQKNWEQ